MAAVINTNYLSLVAQNNLNKSQSSLGNAIERLSSGLRINSAKDDAAGQAIANRFTANINGLTQAARNANDGISIAQTTEGALNEINNNLQRIRQLSSQAATGTNSKSDLDSIQAEITQRLDEITRVSDQTQFNGVKVLQEEQTLKIQVGANDGEVIEIDLKQINASTLGLDKLDMTNQVFSKNLTAVGANISEASPAKTVELSYPPAAGKATLEVASGGTKAGELVAKIGTDYYLATYDQATNTVTFNTNTKATAAEVTGSSATGTFINPADNNLVDLADIAGASQVDQAAAATYQLYRKDDDGTFKVKNAAGDTFTATVDLDSGKVTIGAKDATATNVTTGYTEATGDVLTVPGTAAVAKDMSDVDAALDGTNALFKNTAKDGTVSYLVKNTDADNNVTWHNATVGVDGKVAVTTETVVDPLDAIDKALASVDSLRSDLGAIQNRFESTITNLNNTVNNLSAARSRIEDADYATEVSNMTKAQILQQAGTSVLAQANQVPQTVLSLLR
ncbi:flagellin [Achromobacter denitrificans]|uniref:flagellin N-terminal helical domain-containing protein n=1 Tax=Achromobacter denitrificans TaxID=32002 RepID=UPI003BA07CC2